MLLCHDSKKLPSFWLFLDEKRFLEGAVLRFRCTPCRVLPCPGVSVLSEPLGAVTCCLPFIPSVIVCATKGTGNTLVLCTDLRAFLQDNIQLGKLPVAISSEAAFQNCEACFFV